MSKSPHETAMEWIEFAKEDFETARFLREQERSDRNACFLCQQAAEKFLKAVIVVHKRSIPKIHDLSRLLAEAFSYEEAEPLAKDAVWLSNFAVQIRYPFSALPTTAADVTRALDIALAIKEICETKLNI